MTADRATQIAGIAALEQPIRRDLYALISEKDGWLGRDEAAAALGLPRSVAAFHLDKLADAGLLEIRYERPSGRGGPGAGRPAKTYRRVRDEVSVSLPERRYELAGELLADAVLESRDTGCAVAQALSVAAHKAGAELGAGERATLPRRSSVRALRSAATTVLRRLGYEPREAAGEIALANCPFHRLAERHRSLICGMNLDLITGLSEGLEAEGRLVPRLEPTPEMCCVRIAAR